MSQSYWFKSNFYNLKRIFNFFVEKKSCAYNQSTTNFKKKKYKKNKRRALAKCPQKKGVCLRVFITTPKKPNSALRKVARLRLSNKSLITGYIPGIGHTLQKYSTVLVRGGRVRDLPGVRYKLIRNKYDLRPVYNRTQARSKYGIKAFKG